LVSSRSIRGSNLQPALRGNCWALWSSTVFPGALWRREWELLLNLQEEINVRRKGSRDSHLYPKTSPISVRGTSNAGPFRTSLKEPTCLPPNNRERAILPGCSDIHLLPCFTSFEDLVQKKLFLFSNYGLLDTRMNITPPSSGPLNLFLR
jgi:hypothetical protein